MLEKSTVAPAFTLTADDGSQVSLSDGKTYEGIIRSHFAIDEEGKLTEQKIKVKPETTVDLALHLIQVGLWDFAW